MDNGLLTADNFLYTIAGGAFATLCGYIARKSIKRMEFNRDDRRDAAQAETARINLLMEGYDRYARTLEARINQQDIEIARLREDCAKCMAEKQESERKREALARRITALEMRNDKLDSDYDGDG